MSSVKPEEYSDEWLAEQVQRHIDNEDARIGEEERVRLRRQLMAEQIRQRREQRA